MSERAVNSAVVPTVHGPPLIVDAGVVVDGHAHAWIRPPAGVREEHALHLDDEAVQAEALSALAATAQRWAARESPSPEARTPTPAPRWRAALIDCQPPFAGRDANALAALSRRAGVAIACVTGFHLPRYYAGGTRPWSGADEAAALFIREVVQGLREASGLRAAAIKAAHAGDVSDDLVAWEAAVAAHRATGACLLVHTERGAGVERLVAWLLDSGVAPSGIYLCHVDKRPDLALHAELAGAGVLLGYDTFLRPHYRPEEGVWPLLAGMVAAGHSGSIAVGLDLAAPEQWCAPHAGPVGLVDVVARRLQREIDDPQVVGGLLGGNVLRVLARNAVASPVVGA